MIMQKSNNPIDPKITLCVTTKSEKYSAEMKNAIDQTNNIIYITTFLRRWIIKLPPQIAIRCIGQCRYQYIQIHHLCPYFSDNIICIVYKNCLVNKRISRHSDSYISEDFNSFHWTSWRRRGSKQLLSQLEKEAFSCNGGAGVVCTMDTGLGGGSR